MYNVFEVFLYHLNCRPTYLSLDKLPSVDEVLVFTVDENKITCFITITLHVHVAV